MPFQLYIKPFFSQGALLTNSHYMYKHSGIPNDMEQFLGLFFALLESYVFLYIACYAVVFVIR